MNTVVLNPAAHGLVASKPISHSCALCASLWQTDLMPTRTLVLLLLLVCLSSVATSQTKIPAPAEVLGFTPGDDRKVASWSQVIEYFERLDGASDRVIFQTLGKTSMDKPFVMATISTPENL